MKAALHNNIDLKVSGFMMWWNIAFNLSEDLDQPPFKAFVAMDFNKHYRITQILKPENGNTNLTKN